MALEVRRDEPGAVLLAAGRRPPTAVAPSSAAAASSRSTFRAASVSPYPSSRSMRAIARPIPDEPPVTSALGTRRSSHRRKAARVRRPPRCTREGEGVVLSSATVYAVAARVLPVHSQGDAADADEPREGRRVRREVLRPRGSRSCSAGSSRRTRHDLLVGLDPADDAAVYRLDDEHGARLHRRLLPAGRRRPADVRRDRGDERAQRRVRDGRAAAARALGHRLPGGAADRDARRDPRRRGRGVARGRRDPRRRPHDPRRRAEVRARRRRHRPPGRDLAEERRAARATPSSSRSRSAPGSCSRPCARARAGRRARGGGRGDARRSTATPPTRCGRSRPNAVTDVTGLRAARPRARDGVAQSGVRIELDARSAARAARRARARRGRRPHGRRPPQPRVRRPARRERRGARAARRSPTTRRRPAGCSSRCPRDKRAVLEATFAGRGARRSTRSGRVEAGTRRGAVGEPARARLRGAGRARALRPARRSPRSSRSGSSSPRARSSGSPARASAATTGRGAADAVPREGLPRRWSSSATGWSRSCGILACARDLARGAPGRRACPAGCVGAALAAFLGTVAQIPLGGLTVILDLHPLAVMSHFLLALVVVALAVVVAFEAWSLRERPRRARRAALAAPRRRSSASSRAR